MEKQKKVVTLEPGMEYSAINQCEVALIRLLLEDSKELQQLKPSTKTEQNIRLAQALLNNQTSLRRGYYASKDFCEAKI